MGTPKTRIDFRRIQLFTDIPRNLVFLARFPEAASIAIPIKDQPIPNLPQGACPAQEVGEVGGETSGTARVRAGFAPNKSSSPAQRSLYTERGYGGSRPHVCDFFSSRNQAGAANHQVIVSKIHFNLIGRFGCGYAAPWHTSEPASVQTFLQDQQQSFSDTIVAKDPEESSQNPS